MDILTEALEGASKTRIMYRANLNASRFGQYLSELVQSGLLKKSQKDGRSLYVATEDGKAFLETLREAQRFMSI